MWYSYLQGPVEHSEWRLYKYVQLQGHYGRDTKINEASGDGLMYTHHQESNDRHNYEILKTCSTTILNKLTLYYIHWVRPLDIPKQLNISYTAQETNFWSGLRLEDLFVSYCMIGLEL